MKLTRPQWIRILNYLLYLSFCSMTGTGLLLALRMPRGQGNQGTQLFGLNRHAWSDWHTWLGYAFMALIILHLLLHAKWLWMVASKKSSLKIVFSLLLGLLLILILLIAPLKQRSKQHSKPQHQKSHFNLHSYSYVPTFK